MSRSGSSRGQGMKGTWRPRLAFVTAIGAVLLTVSCNSAGSPLPPSAAAVTAAPEPAAQALSGFLATANNGVVFLQWTRVGDALTGSRTMAYTSGSDPGTLKTATTGLTGVVSGSSVTLSFPEGLGLSTTWTGAFQGSSLVLSYATADGSLSTLTFQPATVAGYNQAFAILQAQVQQAQADAAAAAEASAARAEASAAAAAAAKAAQEARARPACQAVGGQIGWDGGSLVCQDVRYIGQDGSIYASEALVNDETGALEGPMDTAGGGATQQQCISSFYDLPSGPGYGPKGTWNTVLRACIAPSGAP